jgi:non-ribosomal peptide synthetase component F
MQVRYASPPPNYSQSLTLIVLNAILRPAILPSLLGSHDHIRITISSQMEYSMPSSLAHALHSALAQDPDQEALVLMGPDGNQHATRAQIDVHARYTAQHLLEIGVQPGDIIPIMLEHAYEAIPMLLGTLYSIVTICNICCRPLIPVPPLKSLGPRDPYYTPGWSLFGAPGAWRQAQLIRIIWKDTFRNLRERIDELHLAAITGLNGTYYSNESRPGTN